MGKATDLTDQFVQVRINGDQAYLKGLGKVILENPTASTESSSKNTPKDLKNT